MKDPANSTWVETMPYPAGIVKWVFKFPILLYRAGIGALVGRLFMVMTTVGRKSGQPRRTAIEFHELRGRKYVFNNWGQKSDWYRNILADPNITIQTWRGAESVHARRLVTDAELTEAFDFTISNPSLRAVFKAIGFDLNLDRFLAERDRFTFVTFDPVNQPTPEPVQADLVWIWLVVVPLCLLLILLVAR